MIEIENMNTDQLTLHVLADADNSQTAAQI